MSAREEKEKENQLEEKPGIDERIEQLKKAGVTDNKKITQILYAEGYSTHEIMRRHLPLKALKKKPDDDESVMSAIGGTTKGPGYLEEFKTMIQQQISRSRQLTDVFYNVGLGALLAALRKSGIEIEDFRKIALTREGLQGALMKSGETIFKALEYYESDLVTKVEDERDEARAYASLLETRVGTLIKNLDPKLRLEKMIQTYLFSGNVVPETLLALIDKWLALEIGVVKLEMIA